MGLRDEILEQPEALRRQLAGGDAVYDAVAERVRAGDIDTVIIAARGTSDHAAIYAQYVLGVRNRLTVGLAAPSITSLYGVAPRFDRALVIGISQSGASPDIVGVVGAARGQGAPTLAITNDASSPLAGAAEHVVDLRAGPELAVAATKTYTASLLAIARLSAALSATAGGDAGASGPAEVAGAAPRAEAGAAPRAATAAATRAEIDAVPDAVARTLEVEGEIVRLARELAAVDRCVILGRGFEYATAREWALKLKELARVFADPYSAADFQHGPLALIEAGVPILALLPDGPAAAGLATLLETLRSDHGAETVVLSDGPELRAVGGRSIGLPGGVPEWLRPISTIVAGQLFAYHLTVAKGLDPEAPRNLNKVTRTH